MMLMELIKDRMLNREQQIHDNYISAMFLRVGVIRPFSRRSWDYTSHMYVERV
jgi:hypothetical protein